MITAQAKQPRGMPIRDRKPVRGQKRHWNDDENARLRQMYLAGAELQEIARAFDVSESTVCGRVTILGLPRRSRLAPDERQPRRLSRDQLLAVYLTKTIGSAEALQLSGRLADMSIPDRIAEPRP